MSKHDVEQKHQMGAKFEAVIGDAEATFTITFPSLPRVLTERMQDSVKDISEAVINSIMTTVGAVVRNSTTIHSEVVEETVSKEATRH